MSARPWTLDRDRGRHLGRGAASFSLRPCAQGDACDDPVCRAFHHGGPLCRFVPHCRPPMGRQCPFRHPRRVATAREPDPADPLGGSNEPPAPSALAAPETRHPLPIPTPRPLLPIHERLSAARAAHQRLLENERTRLGRLDEKMASQARTGDLTVDAEHRAMKFALCARGKELESQASVFDTVVKRILSDEGLTDDLKKNQLERELYHFQALRSIGTSRLEIEDQVMSASSRFLVIQSSDGCGSTVRVSQYMAQLPCFSSLQILKTEVTTGMAQVRSTQVAFEQRGGFSNSRQLTFVSQREVVDLLRRARECSSVDHPLQRVGCLVVNNARRTNLDCVAVLNSLKDDHPALSHLRVVVIVSPLAPLEVGHFARELSGAAIIRTSRCNFPVRLTYQPFPNPRTGRAGFVDTELLPLVASRVVLKALDESVKEGDVVCFLPSRADVVQARWHLERELEVESMAVAVCVLFEGPDTIHLDELLRARAPQNQRVVFSTGELDFDVAMETVSLVVDSGLEYATCRMIPLQRISLRQDQSVRRRVCAGCDSRAEHNQGVVYGSTVKPISNEWLHTMRSPARTFFTRPRYCNGSQMTLISSRASSHRVQSWTLGLRV